MNKKEVAEIKKQFKLCNDYMVINKISCYYIKEKEVISSFIKKFAGEDSVEHMSAYVGGNDALEYLDIAKKTLSGQIGKGLTEYAFPNEQLTNKDSQHAQLSRLVDSRLEHEDDVNDYVDFLKNKYDGNEYIIVIQHCSYGVPVKNKNAETDMDSDTGEEFDFIITSFCPVDYTRLGLIYNETSKEITSSENSEKTVGKPTDGFMFPAFNDRSKDINSVLVFNKTPKEPNKTIVEEILGCEFIMSAEEEKEKFNTLITKVVTGDNPEDIAVDYSITQSMHSQISDMIKKNSVESETPTLSAYDLKMILRRSGVDESKLSDFDELYEEEIGDDVNLKAVNVINPDKLDIKSPDIVINVKADKTDKVVSKVIDGKRCLVVELDENVEINGLDVIVK